MNKQTFAQIVTRIETEQLQLCSLSISQLAPAEQTFSHQFTQENERTDLRSVSKTMIALAVGVAIHEGRNLGGERIRLDMKVWEFLQDAVKLINLGNAEYLEKLTLRHLLTHTIGFSKGLMFSRDLENMAQEEYANYVVNTDISYLPGTYFEYTNAGPFLLSVIITETLGISLSEWVNDLLFSKMGITDFLWKSYGKYCAGPTGLMMNSTDVHKIALLLLNNGIYDGSRIISAKWLKEMTSVQVLTPKMENSYYPSDRFPQGRMLPKHGYGILTWISPSGDYYCDGTDGQYIIISPTKGLAITTTGKQKDMKPITECFRGII